MEIERKLLKDLLDISEDQLNDIIALEENWKCVTGYLSTKPERVCYKNIFNYATRYVLERGLEELSEKTARKLRSINFDYPFSNDLERQFYNYLIGEISEDSFLDSAFEDEIERITQRLDMAKAEIDHLITDLENRVNVTDNIEIAENILKVFDQWF